MKCFLIFLSACVFVLPCLLKVSVFVSASLNIYMYRIVSFYINTLLKFVFIKKYFCVLSLIHKYWNSASVKLTNHLPFYTLLYCRGQQKVLASSPNQRKKNTKEANKTNKQNR